MFRPVLLPACVSLIAALTAPSLADGFDAYGNAAADFAPVQATPDFMFILGGSIGVAPAYEGASDYGLTFAPIIEIERLKFWLVDIDTTKSTGGLALAPSFGFVAERKSADHAALAGLNDVGATFAVGGRVSYQAALNPMTRAEVYGAARYAFGGTSGVVGELGIDLIADVSPQLEVRGGPMLSFASNGYMDSYFGVTAAESVATGGRLAAFDPKGGIKSVGVAAQARYEFVPDTFVSVNTSYSAYIGDTANSPIVTSGSQHQFTASLGLARRLWF